MDKKEKHKEDKDMPAVANQANVYADFSRKKRVLPKRTNKIDSMSPEDWKEANEITKRNRGLSRLSLKDIFEEDN